MQSGGVLWNRGDGTMLNACHCNAGDVEVWEGLGNDSGTAKETTACENS